MKTYRLKVKQVYIETMFVEAESEDDAVQLMWSDDFDVQTFDNLFDAICHAKETYLT